MSTAALFHSALGVRAGVIEAADRLRADGHEVIVVDQFDGRTFDDYDEANAHVESIGFPALMEKAVAGVRAAGEDLVVVGFSNGGGMAQYVATQRPVSGVVMASGALPLEMLGAPSWPAGVPAQIHYAANDPFRHEPWLESVVASVTNAGAPLETYVDYPGSGHLFTDPSLPREYGAESAELFYDRLSSFCRRVTAH